MKMKQVIPKFTKEDLPFERPKYDSSYKERVRYTELKKYENKNGKKKVKEIEHENKHVCFSGLRNTINVKRYTNVRVYFGRTVLTQLEILKWFNYLNQVYRRELFVVDFKTNEVRVHFDKLAAPHRKHWRQILNIYGLVRYLYEEGKPMTVRGAIYLKDKRPNSDFMHCITASDIMTYGRHIDYGRHNGHSIFDHGLGTKVSFHLFKLRLKKGTWINDAIKQKRDLPKLKYTQTSRASQQIRMNEKFKCNFDSHTPLTIINKWHQYVEQWDQTEGKKKKEEEELRRERMNKNKNKNNGEFIWF
jgi:hypothetical protein